MFFFSFLRGDGSCGRRGKRGGIWMGWGATELEVDEMLTSLVVAGF